MSTSHQILCINKSDRLISHERITHIGGKNGDGSGWRITQAETITGIENAKWQFFVMRGGIIAKVNVSVSKYRNKYLKTTSDGDQPNNLLILPECI